MKNNKLQNISTSIFATALITLMITNITLEVLDRINSKLKVRIPSTYSSVMTSDSIKVRIELNHNNSIASLVYSDWGTTVIIGLEADQLYKVQEMKNSITFRKIPAAFNVGPTMVGGYTELTFSRIASGLEVAVGIIADQYGTGAKYYPENLNFDNVEATKLLELVKVLGETS